MRYQLRQGPGSASGSGLVDVDVGGLFHRACSCFLVHLLLGQDGAGSGECDEQDPSPQVVGLRGLEPLTSSLSGKRSNRLSYRPRVVHSRTRDRVDRREGYPMRRSPHKTRARLRLRGGSAVLGEGDFDASQQGGRQVVEERARVAIAVIRMTSTAAIIVKPSTREVPRYSWMSTFSVSGPISRIAELIDPGHRHPPE